MRRARESDVGGQGEYDIEQLVQRVQILEAAAAESDARRAEVEQRLQQVVAQLQQQSHGGSVPGTAMIDMKNLVPTRYSGKAAEFTEWSLKTSSYLCKACPELQKLLVSATKSAMPVPSTTMTEQENALGWQVYYALTMLCEGEATKLVSSCGVGQGFECWRQLHQQWAPRVAARRTADMMDIMDFHFSADLVKSLLALDVKVREYQETHRREIDCDMLAGVLIRTCPNVHVRRHLLENAEKYKTWEDLKLAILSLCRIESLAMSSRTQASTSTGAGTSTGLSTVPMEVDFVKEKGLECFKCGGHHFARECRERHNDSNHDDDGSPQECEFCGRRGHEQRKCFDWIRASTAARQRAKGKGRGKGKVHEIDIASEEQQHKEEPEPRPPSVRDVNTVIPVLPPNPWIF
ncbi:unnamed protein product [Polarella glacialis]|uniref:CCHC-type domain-containing protein n=1 Tax=Polarella glacialis TaxID=89957 RepID=A0A813E5A9_POLGL|nr:unnamed protein product [Polarella glacialis]CAE8660103.1 unnamed protein product [Polarella glacialis]